MKPVDYDVLAPQYDRHRRGGGPFLDTLVALARRAGAGVALEIGAGTGNNTRAFLDARPGRLVALDRSRNMLQQAALKNLRARWILANAEQIPLAAQSIRFVFAVCVLHHIRELRILFCECMRVLAPGGMVALVTSPQDFIERHPMNRYFPSFARVDKARFQDVPEVIGAMQSAGFAETGVIRDVGDPHPIDQAYFDKVAARFISTYDLIPDVEFQQGLARFKADIDAHGLLDTPIAWECATVWGRRPSPECR